MAVSFFGCTGLTGGETGDLDVMDGTKLQDGAMAIVVISEWSYIYYLDADSGATESPPQVIAPNTNPGDKRWILAKHVEYIPTMDKRQVFIQSDEPTGTESNVGDLWIDIT